MTNKFLHTLYILLQGRQGNDYIMKFEIRNLEKTYFNSLISNIQFLISEHEFF